MYFVVGQRLRADRPVPTLLRSVGINVAGLYRVVVVDFYRWGDQRHHKKP
ncbi:MAG: hypothetical protein AAB393_07280 [Bacteroidota bacterium]